MQTLLLVEDDKALRYLLKQSLEQDDFLVLEAMNGKRAIEIVSAHNVDAILMDIHLPDGNGIHFIKKIRVKTDVPLIIVSGAKNKSFRIEGLNAGADDYVAKPFNTPELVARIRAHLRRYQGLHRDRQTVTNINDRTAIITLGEWTFNREHYQLFNQQKQSAGLSIHEFLLLDALICHANRPVPRDDLCYAIKTNNYIPTARAIDVKITRLRKKIGDNAANPAIIKTVRGVGYMINI